MAEIEMRWVVPFNIGILNPENKYLQFRIRVTDQFLGMPFVGEWSEWKTVPTVIEETQNDQRPADVDNKEHGL